MVEGFKNKPPLKGEVDFAEGERRKGFIFFKPLSLLRRQLPFQGSRDLRKQPQMRKNIRR